MLRSGVPAFWVATHTIVHKWPPLTAKMMMAPCVNPSDDVLCPVPLVPP